MSPLVLPRSNYFVTAPRSDFASALARCGGIRDYYAAPLRGVSRVRFSLTLPACRLPALAYRDVSAMRHFIFAIFRHADSAAMAGLCHKTMTLLPLRGSTLISCYRRSSRRHDWRQFRRDCRRKMQMAAYDVTTPRPPAYRCLAASRYAISSFKCRFCHYFMFIGSAPMVDTAAAAAPD